MSPARRLAQLRELPVTRLETVTSRRAAALGKMGIESVLDLVTHYPRRYVDRTRQRDIGALREGEEAVVSGAVRRTSSRRLRGGRSLAEITVADGTGTLVCSFFNQPWRARQFEEGQVVTVFGKATFYRGRLQMANPIVDLVGDQTNRIVAVYPQSKKAGVSSPEIAKYVGEALTRAGEFAEPIPEVASSLGLVARTAAFTGIHIPESDEDHRAARTRLAFDELLRLQLLLVSRRRADAASSNGIAHASPGPLLERYVAGLPFELTNSQEKAFSEIVADLEAPHPMNRLLQGDVGAGKTVVALAALLVGVEGGYQGALMVPTEVLAEQHFLSARHLLGELEVDDDTSVYGRRPLRVRLLTSKTGAAERAELLAELAGGRCDVVVGTHALLSEGVDFARLGVVVVDEQHRFGVEQRAALREKAERDPDLLVMTATPIPRTAAMTVYGDLDQTVIDELPAGRAPVTTRWLSGEEAEASCWERVLEQVALGHQVYVVCPLIGDDGAASDDEADDPDSASEAADEEDDGDDDEEEEEGTAAPSLPGLSASERRPARAAVPERARLEAGPLEGTSVGLLHGQMPTREKEAVMAAFREREVDVLVATTVVEVGVDVANATVMVIEDADRFGLAQLHQLRGRVGRSRHPSWCYLLTGEAVTEPAERRLAAMVSTQNGFELAEEDLDLRGGGTVLGARQKGRSDLKAANLRRDRELVVTARREAERIVQADATLGGPYALLREEVETFVSEDERAFLFRS